LPARHAALLLHADRGPWYPGLPACSNEFVIGSLAVSAQT